MHKMFYISKFRKSLISSLLGVLLILFSVSCEEFLDEVPDNRVALDNLDKAQQLLTNAYSVSSYAFTDWMSDNVGFTTGVNVRTNHRQAYEWEDFTDGPTVQDTPTFFWFETYTSIAHANEVLAVLDELPANTEELVAQRNAAESEALLTRAYGHFMLVNLFAKHYDEATAGSNSGVPYVDTPETVFIKEYQRNTIKEVYDKVEEDMLRGIELLDEGFFANSGKYHFNKNAALALASRFYLFKGDHIQCIDFSNQLLGSNAENFVRDMTSQEFQNASSSISGYPQLYSSPDLPSNLLMMRKISLVQRTDFAHGPLSSFYGQLFASHPFIAATDTRENPAFVKGSNALFPVRYESLFERSSLNSNVGFPYHINLAFRGEEVLLNRAESFAMLNRLNEAMDDLQVLTDNRYTGTDVQLSIPLLRDFFGVTGSPFVTDQQIVLEYIYLERRKEFIAQGLRWFDIKRLELPVDHVQADGISVIRLEEDDLRKVLQIPTSAVDVGGLQPNPR